MDIVMIKSLFALIISFLITFHLIPILYNIAFSLKVVDVPDGKIKCHTTTTPYLGGIAVYTGFIVALALVFPFDNQFSLFFIGLTLLVLVGLIDDLVVMKPLQKILGQCIAALCFLKAGLYIKERFFIHNLVSIPISFLWMLSVINAFNLVDIMDGLSTTIAFFAALSFLIIALLFKQASVVMLLCAFMGPLVAFFYYNKPQAKMYLGDAGSLFLGGFMAVIPFLLNWGIYNNYGYIAPLVILLIPLLEVTALIIIRTYKGIPFYMGSPDHFALYLRKRAWTVWQVLGFTGAMSMGLLGIAVPFAVNGISMSQVFTLLLVFIFLWKATIFKQKPYKTAHFMN